MTKSFNFRPMLAAACMLGASFTRPRDVDAQIAYETAETRVEVLGLHRWTLKMLQDSIGHYVRGLKLEDAACMVTLREQLHFIEASVMTYNGFGPPEARVKPTLVVMVVEPQDSAKVKWDVRPRNEFSSLRPDYASLVLPVTDTAGGFWTGRLQQWFQAYTYDAALRARVIALMPDKARAGAEEDADRLWKFLDKHRSDADRIRALTVLRTDGFFVNRFVATMILGNFPASDSTWWTLARAMRDPHEGVRGAASLALSHMPARRIDWTPVVEDLRLLIGGTNLPSILSTFELLTRTEVSPGLTPALLHGNSQWLLDHLGATYPTASTTAHKLLVRLNAGVDLGPKRADWEKWAASR